MFMERQLKAEYAPITRASLTADHDKATDILARTLWAEARGEQLMGIEAVANVIINRVTHAKQQGGFWWGNDVIAVCQKPAQFSCWTKADPNYFKLQNVTPDDRVFAMCQRIARRAISGVLTDNTQRATHYHADTIQPKWAVGVTPIITIGHHIFYRILN